MEDKLKRFESETENEYIARLYKNKIEYGLTNKEVCNILNAEMGYNKAESTYRSIAYPYNEGFDNGYERALQSKEKNDDLTILKHGYENYEQFKSYREVTEINKDGSYSSDKLIGIEDESNLKDENFLLKVHGYDSKFWEIVSARNSIWNTQLKGGKVTKLYASKINVKPRKSSISMEEIKEHFENFNKNHTYTKQEYKPITYSGKLLELPIMDLHLGKLGFKDELGEEYNSQIAEERFLGIIKDVINRTKHYDFDKIIFPVGQDFFNFDGIDGNTTKGTRQDNDMRWQGLFLKGVELLIKAIDMLSEQAPVEVFYVAGNHDKTMSYYSTAYLHAWYRNNERVDISVDMPKRKYVEFGRCLIGFSHGETERKRLNGIMQIEARESWGRTIFHEWHCGHYHSEITKEENGLIVRYISSVTGSDAWHNESGYVGAIKKAQAFIWDKQYGLTDIINSIII